MRNPLRRYYGRGDLHFVTFSCYPLAVPGQRPRLVKVLDQVRARQKFLLIGYVVMAEHGTYRSANLGANPKGAAPCLTSALRFSVSLTL